MGRKKRQYVKLDYDLLHSHLWQNLSLAARQVYIQLKASRNRRTSRGKIINKTDNFIRFGFSDSNGMSRPTFKRATLELEEAGLIWLMEPGRFPGKKSAYALLEDWREIEKGLNRKTQWD